MKISNISTIILFVVYVSFYSCSKDDSSNSATTLKADFSVVVSDIIVNESFQFKNVSKGEYETVTWDFGDGSISTSTDPYHSYSELGNYKVTLTVKNGTVENKVTKEIIVSLSENISGRLSLIDKLNTLNGKMMVCAHRGEHYDVPENSLKSIETAISNNLNMVEIDIRPTKDGELVLMHDPTIDRTTNGSGKVSDYLLSELKQFNLYKPNGTLSTEKIPTLKEVLALTRGKVYIDLDIDNRSKFNKVYPLVRQYGMVSQVLFCSSELLEIKEMVKVSNVLALPIIRSDNFNDYASLSLNIVQFNIDNNTIASNIQGKNWKIFRLAYVNTNTTPANDNYGQLNEVIALKGSIVQTDYPEEVKSKLQSLNLKN